MRSLHGGISGEGVRMLDNFLRSRVQCNTENLYWILYSMVKETLVTKTDKTDTPRCVYASF